MVEVDERQKEYARLGAIEGEIRALAEKFGEFQHHQPIRAAINTLGSDQFVLLKPIEVVIQCTGEDEYVASFFEANVNASGCNPNQAFENLVDTIMTRFETYENLPPEKLGKGPKRYVAVLREFIRRGD